MKLIKLLFGKGKPSSSILTLRGDQIADTKMVCDLISLQYREHPVVILGSSPTALGTARSLGRLNIPIICIDLNKKDAACYSKFCQSIVVNTSEATSEKDLISLLINIGGNIGEKGVLVPTSDIFVLLVAKNQAALKEYFYFPLLDEQVYEDINNKWKLYNLALRYNVSVPRTYHPRNVSELYLIAREINYPCVIKPFYSFLFKEPLKKAIKSVNQPDLVENYRISSNQTDKIIVQELIKGGEQYSLCTYFNNDSEPLASFTSRKVRQPYEFGVGTLVESCDVPEIKEIGINFLKNIKYKGLAEIEFKKDSMDSRYKLIEVNTRPWMQINLSVRCGINFPYIQYCDLTGKQVEQAENNSHFQRKTIWIDFIEYAISSIRDKRRLYNGDLIKDLVNLLIHKREYAYFALDDFKPFLYKIVEIWHRFLRLWHKKWTHNSRT